MLMKRKAMHIHIQTRKSEKYKTTMGKDQGRGPWAHGCSEGFGKWDGGDMGAYFILLSLCVIF